MKKIFLPLMYFFFLLCACSTPSDTAAQNTLMPTAVPPTSTFTPTPEVSPTPEPTADAAAEVLSAQGMTARYVHQFAKGVEKGTKLVNGQEVDVFYGVKYDGTKHLIAMDVEIDGKMTLTRVGEYQYGDYSFYVFMNPNTRVSPYMAVTTETAKIFFNTAPENPRDFGLFVGIAKQMGISESAVADKIIQNGGKITMSAPMGIPGSTADYPVRFKTVELDLSKPVMITAITSVEEYNLLSQETKDNIVFDNSIYKESGVLRGGLLHRNTSSGQTELIVISINDIEIGSLFDGVHYPNAAKGMAHILGDDALRIFDLIQRASQGSAANANTRTIAYNRNNYGRQDIVMFEYTIP